jgi:hypothetical protein
MSQDAARRIDHGEVGRYLVDYQAGDHGPEVAVGCLRCGKAIGIVLARGREEVLCDRCGIVFETHGTESGLRVRELRRVPVIEQSDLPPPGQVLNRPDIEIDIGLKRRLILLLWALALSAAGVAGVWAVLRWTR